MHGGINVSGEKFSVGFVFRVMNGIGLYHKVDDTLVVQFCALSFEHVVLSYAN